jgi:succinate dehydrogenase/fumarate reductase flavoprotein subunit
VSLRAENPHEMGRSLEVISVMNNAEMVLRASLQRKESRKIPFGFYRADFPEKNDADYFAFLGQRFNGKEVEFSKIDIHSIR